MGHLCYLLETSPAFLSASQRAVRNYGLDGRIYLFLVIYKTFYVFTEYMSLSAGELRVLIT
jgi:hypothetical protein